MAKYFPKSIFNPMEAKLLVGVVIIAEQIINGFCAVCENGKISVHSGFLGSLFIIKY